MGRTFSNLRADIRRHDARLARLGPIRAFRMVWSQAGLQALVVYRLGRWLKAHARRPFLWPLMLLLAPLYLLLQHIAFSIAMKRTYIPFVRAALTARGHPTCIACGHLLGPATPTNCPECGSGTSDPR